MKTAKAKPKSKQRAGRPVEIQLFFTPDVAIQFGQGLSIVGEFRKHNHDTRPIELIINANADGMPESWDFLIETVKGDHNLPNP